MPVILASVISVIITALLATVIFVLVQIVVFKCHPKFTPGGAETGTSAGGEGHDLTYFCRFLFWKFHYKCESFSASKCFMATYRCYVLSICICMNWHGRVLSGVIIGTGTLGFDFLEPTLCIYVHTHYAQRKIV